jgi:hypothetical protein
MPRSRVSLLSWVVAIAFILASALVLVDRFNLFATPPELPESSNLVERMIALEGYRQAIWPVFLWTNLLFAVGFVAVVAFAAAVASMASASGVTSRLTTFRSLATAGGLMAAIASVIPLGAVQASVWGLYCDCGFKETEIVAGVRAQMVAEDVEVWLNRVASMILAVALIALVRDARVLISPTLRTWTWLTAIVLVLWPILGIAERTDPIAEELLALVAGAVLVPVWAVWLGRAVERAPGAASA